MTPEQFAYLPPELRGEIEARIRRKQAIAHARRFVEDLHPKQKTFACDQSRRMVALCSRRAGKSHGILAWLIDGALEDPGGLSVYVARSKGDARRILQPAIDYFHTRYPDLKLKLREIDGQLLLIVGLTRHTIWLAGCKHAAEVSKFRGSKYKRVAVDEAQEYGAFLRELVTDAFEPALIDKAGHLLLAGTPSPIPAGLFYECSTGDGGPQWPTHHWTIFDNPHIPDAAAEVEGFCLTYALDKSSATFRREYLGQWVRDDGALVFPYNAALNSCQADDLPPAKELNFVLGVDIGFADATAFTICAIKFGAPEVWIARSWKKSGLIPSAVAAHVERLREHYGGALRVVVDEGGIGKGYAEEMRQRYSIACEPAEKTKKRAFQEIVAGELRSGTVKIVQSECRDLIDEISILQWLPDRASADPRFEDHAADSFLYAVRACRAWYSPEIDAPKHGTAEWFAAEARATRAEMTKRAESRSKKMGGLRGRR